MDSDNSFLFSRINDFDTIKKLEVKNAIEKETQVRYSFFMTGEFQEFEKELEEWDRKVT